MLENQKTARGAATRACIVEAAADLIYVHGVERTSLDDLMAVTSVSKSQLYHYFSDKVMSGKEQHTDRDKAPLLQYRPRPHLPPRTVGIPARAAQEGWLQ